MVRYEECPLCKACIRKNSGPAVQKYRPCGYCYRQPKGKWKVVNVVKWKKDRWVAL